MVLDLKYIAKTNKNTLSEEKNGGHPPPHQPFYTKREPSASNQTLYWSYRFGVWRLSHWLCPRREESPAQKIVGATAAQNQFASAVCTTQVYSDGWNQWKLFAAPSFLCTGTFLSTRYTRFREPSPVSLLSYSRGGVVNVRGSFKSLPIYATQVCRSSLQHLPELLLLPGCSHILHLHILAWNRRWFL